MFTLCVNKTQVTGQVQLQGFTGTAVGHARTVTFVATGGASTKTWVLNLSNVSGDTFNYSLSGVPVGTTGLSAKTDWNLRRKLVVALDGNGQAAANFTGASKLNGGDISGPSGSPDNIINLFDYAQIAANWQSLTDPAADINGDGVINVFDYSILASNWLTAGDPQ